MAGSDEELLPALRRSDPEAFRQLVGRYHPAMVRAAAAVLPDRSAAEDVVQETWLAVLLGLPGFEGRSGLRPWLFAILLNRARTRAARDGRRSAAELPLEDGAGPAVPPDRFTGRPGRGRWRTPVAGWQDDPELRLGSAAALRAIRSAIGELPPARRLVLTLRDVEGWPAAEVSALLGITEGHQRVLLHRARNGVRSALEEWRG